MKQFEAQLRRLEQDATHPYPEHVIRGIYGRHADALIELGQPADPDKALERVVKAWYRGEATRWWAAQEEDLANQMSRSGMRWEDVHAAMSRRTTTVLVCGTSSCDAKITSHTSKITSHTSYLRPLDRTEATMVGESISGVLQCKSCTDRYLAAVDWSGALVDVDRLGPRVPEHVRLLAEHWSQGEGEQASPEA